MNEANIFDIFTEILAERQRQDQQWGGPAHDDAHELPDWFDFMETQTSRAMDDYLDGRMDDGTRRRLVNGAALFVAAIQSFDRKRAEALGEQTPSENALKGLIDMAELRRQLEHLQ